MPPPIRFVSWFTTATAESANPPRFLTASMAAEVGILLALSLLFPFMIHILPVPEDARLGPRLLPMFYAPLLAALLGRTRSAVIVALVAPWLNWAVTSHPIPPVGLVMTIQLLVFVGIVRGLVTRVGLRWFLAAPAYLGGVAVAAIVVAVFPALIGGRPAMGWMAQIVTTGLPGIGVLLLINALVIRNYPPGSGGGPAAAA
jgi:hypothetical protein